MSEIGASKIRIITINITLIIWIMHKYSYAFTYIYIMVRRCAMELIDSVRELYIYEI